MTEEHLGSRTVLRANAKTGTVGLIVIAAGTTWEIELRDARSFIKWADDGGPLGMDPPRTIVYHHTAGGVMAKRSARYELNLLIEMARSSTWGLPYNFIVMPRPPFRIWYLNDIDHRWPHTYGGNHLTAIAAYGNYSLDMPDHRLAQRMMALADALAQMWGRHVPERQHRDYMPTECPGNYLSPMLPSFGRDRDA